MSALLRTSERKDWSKYMAGLCEAQMEEKFRILVAVNLLSYPTRRTATKNYTYKYRQYWCDFFILTRQERFVFI